MIDDFDHVELRRFADGEIVITIVAELCEDCGERVRYWNTGDVGNAACNCTVEGPEACDRIPMRPQVLALIEAAVRQAKA